MAHATDSGEISPLKPGHLRVVHYILGPVPFLTTNMLEMHLSRLNGHVLTCVPQDVLKHKKFMYVYNIDDANAVFRQADNVLVFSVLNGSARVAVCWITCKSGSPIPAKELMAVRAQYDKLVVFVSHPDLHEQSLSEQICNLLLSIGMMMIKEDRAFTEKGPLDICAISLAFSSNVETAFLTSNSYVAEELEESLSFIIADIDCNVPIKAPYVIEECSSDSINNDDYDDDFIVSSSDSDDAVASAFMCAFVVRMAVEMGLDTADDAKSRRNAPKKKKKKRRKKALKKPASVENQSVCENDKSDLKEKAIEIKTAAVSNATTSVYKVEIQTATTTEDSKCTKKKKKSAVLSKNNSNLVKQADGTADQANSDAKNLSNQSSRTNGTEKSTVGGSERSRQEAFDEFEQSDRCVSFSAADKIEIMENFRSRVGARLGLLLEKRWDTYEKWRNDKTDDNWQLFLKTVNEVRSVMNVTDTYQLPGIDVNVKY